VVGLDVHKESIVAAVLRAGGERALERSTIHNRPAAVEQLVKRIGSPTTIFVYEAGPCRYELHRQLTALGQRVVVVAPTLTPLRPGDRVKTDRRDGVPRRVNRPWVRDPPWQLPSSAR